MTGVYVPGSGEKDISKVIKSLTAVAGAQVTDEANIAALLAGPLVSGAVAAKSDQTTATSTTLAVTPGRQQFHPSAAKAWASFTSAASPVIQASYNVSGVVKNSTGNYTITFTTAFANAFYNCNISVELTGTFATSSILGYVTNGSRSVSSITIQTINYVSGSPTVSDPATVFISCFGTQ